MTGRFTDDVFLTRHGLLGSYVGGGRGDSPSCKLLSLSLIIDGSRAEGTRMQNVTALQLLLHIWVFKSGVASKDPLLFYF